MHRFKLSDFQWLISITLIRCLKDDFSTFIFYFNTDLCRIVHIPIRPLALVGLKLLAELLLVSRPSAMLTLDLMLLMTFASVVPLLSTDVAVAVEQEACCSECNVIFIVTVRLLITTNSEALCFAVVCVHRTGNTNNHMTINWID